MSETAIVKSNPNSFYDRMDASIGAIEAMGGFFANSGLFGCKKREQGMVLAMTCMARGIDPVEAAATYHIIETENGFQLAMKADAMLAKFHQRGGKSKILSRTPELASVELSKDGLTQTFCYSWTEAQQEPYVWGKPDAKGQRTYKKNWRTPRARMQTLWARVVSDGIRAMAPEINFGTPAIEEEDESETTTGTGLFTQPAAPNGGSSAPDDHSATAQAVQGTPEQATPPIAPTKPNPKLEVILDGDTGLLSIDTVTTLLGLVPEDKQEAAGKWLVSKGWLQDGQDLRYLSAHRAQRILENPAGFIAQLNPQPAQ